MRVSDLRLGRDGAELHPSTLSAAEVGELIGVADGRLDGRRGVRLYDSNAVRRVSGPQGAIGRIACALLGSSARPVRAVMFDKSAASNWAVGWHQDRTIAVAARVEAPGFGPWSVKDGAIHVEPPFGVIQAMVTLRAHLDDCGEDNAPLLIAPGSHKLGRVPASQVAQAAQGSDAAACLATTGDVWCYATSILHASRSAAVPRRRRVLQVDFSPETLPHGLEWLGV